MKRLSSDLDLESPTQKKIELFRENLLKWFKEYGRLFPWRNKSTTIYQRIIAEILLQRTQAGTAARLLPEFLAKYPSWKTLSQATEGELAEYLRPIGLWNQRASALYRLASEMIKRNGRFPTQRTELESLPGIGQYIANAVLLFQYGERQPLLDSNMARLLERYFGPRKLVDIRYDPYLQDLSRKVLEVGNPKELNWAMLDHGALICTKNPRCDECPLREGCLFAN